MPDALAKLESEMKLRGQLPQGSLSDLLDSLKPAEPAATAPRDARRPVRRRRRIARTTTGLGAVDAGGDRSGQGATGDDRSAYDASFRACAAQRPDRIPAAIPALVGKGRICADQIAGKRGPPLVVVPGLAGGRPYAMSRAEISVSDFNKFCAATHQCSAGAGRPTGSPPACR